MRQVDYHFSVIFGVLCFLWTIFLNSTLRGQKISTRKSLKLNSQSHFSALIILIYYIYFFSDLKTLVGGICLASYGVLNFLHIRSSESAVSSKFLSNYMSCVISLAYLSHLFLAFLLRSHRLCFTFVLCVYGGYWNGRPLLSMRWADCSVAPL